MIFRPGIFQMLQTLDPSARLPSSQPSCSNTVQQQPSNCTLITHSNTSNMPFSDNSSSQTIDPSTPMTQPPLLTSSAFAGEKPALMPPFPPITSNVTDPFVGNIYYQSSPQMSLNNWLSAETQRQLHQQQSTRFPSQQVYNSQHVMNGNYPGGMGSMQQVFSEMVSF